MSIHIGFLVVGAAIIALAAALIGYRLRNRADRSKQKYIDALWGALVAVLLGGTFIVLGIARPINRVWISSLPIIIAVLLAGILALWILRLRDEQNARKRDLSLGEPTEPRPASFWALFVPLAFSSTLLLSLIVLPYVLLATLAETNGQSLEPTDGRATVAISVCAAVAVTLAALIAGLRWALRRRAIGNHQLLLEGIRFRLADSFEAGKTADGHARFDEGYAEGYDSGYYTGLDGRPHQKY